MSETADGAGAMVASELVVRELLSEASKKGYESGGVLALRARPKWDGPTEFVHGGADVVIVPCESTLAVWEALRRRQRGKWLVVLTTQDDVDLGASVLGHVVYGRVRTPDPWLAVGNRFAANRLEPSLYTRVDNRQLALGLLAAIPADGWPPAPGGVLTESHAFHAVARTSLQIVERGVDLDLRAVVEWSARPAATAQLADLRDLAGNVLADAMITWIAARCGRVEKPVKTLLQSGKVADIVPLGLIAGLLTADDGDANRAAGVFQGRYGFGHLSKEELSAWHTEVAEFVAQPSQRDNARRAAEVATTRLAELDLVSLGGRSDLLPAGLAARIVVLANELQAVLPSASDGDVDRPVIRADLGRLEDAWERVLEHHLAAGDRTVKIARAAVRLARWLASDASAQTSLRAVVRRHVDDDAWVDAAVNDVVPGTSSATVGETLASLLDLVRARRDEHDLAFATALAAHEDPDEMCVEQILPEFGVPLARKHPVMLLVIDALSVSVATELVQTANAEGWAEYAVDGNRRRRAALAVLPTLTQASRCSLLSGELCRGDADAERRGFARLLKANKLAGEGLTPVFHQKHLDAVRPGMSLAPSAQAAIADTANHKIVAAVLNIVDDTLHHTDPTNAEWNVDTITHLRPLLEAARQAGRIVLITSDHGHVIERRHGSDFRRHETTYGHNRARALVGDVAPDEVVVRGPRVITEDHTAVLAVNERIRYGPINAGYHGGASAAEAIVPVVVLHAGDLDADLGLSPVTSPEPDWWSRASRQPLVAEPKPAALFEVAAPEPAPIDPKAEALAKKVVTSRVFQQQKRVAGRVTISDERIRTLLAALLAAPGGRLPAGDAAVALDIAVPRLRGALPMLKRLLDVEGYVVLAWESETSTVVLDERVLAEQFGLKR